ncbi:Uncharacterised protein [uncultured archaeon]|nr:Uncharacterised protein [uncultured archaeon]
MYIGSDDNNIYAFTAGQTDATPPNINITSPINNTSTTDNSATIFYTRSDDFSLASCWYSNDSYTINTTIPSCNNITSVIWSIGQHNLTIWANDTNGNENNSTIRFTISIAPGSEDSNIAGTSEGGSFASSFVVKEGEIGMNVFLLPSASTKTIISKNGKTGIKEVEIKARGLLIGKLYYSLTNQTNIPQQINYPSQYEVYNFLVVNHTINESNLNLTRIRIGISSNWINSNNFSEIKIVKSYPYYKELVTIFVNNTGEEEVYDFFTDSFSTFAIIGVLNTGNQTQNSDTDQKENNFLAKSNFSYWIIFGSCLIVLLFILLIVRKKKKI